MIKVFLESLYTKNRSLWDKVKHEIDYLLPRVDSRREKFYNINTGGNWHDKENYTLCLNSSKLGVDGCTAMIVSAVRSLPDPE